MEAELPRKTLFRRWSMVAFGMLVRWLKKVILYCLIHSGGAGAKMGVMGQLGRNKGTVAVIHYIR